MMHKKCKNLSRVDVSRVLHKISATLGTLWKLAKKRMVTILKMADEGEFKIVSRKKSKKRGFNRKFAIKETSKDSSFDRTLDECNIDRIVAQIEAFGNDIQASSFYTSLKELFLHHSNGESNDKIIKSCTQDSLSEKKQRYLQSNFDEIICYGVGCIQTCPNAKYQFALLLLLKAFFKVPNDHCFIYEPLFNENDKDIVQHFGCSVIHQNEEAKRAIAGHTLFFMPHCSKLLYNNVLWANWGPTLKNVVIFGNGFSSYQQRIPSRQLNKEVLYIAKILPYLLEVNIPNTFHLKDIFNDSSLHFFPEHVLSKIAQDFWTPCPEPTYDINDPEIVTIGKQRKENIDWDTCGTAY